MGADPDARKPEHLVIMVNGIVGSATDWRFAADQFQARFGSSVLVHCSARNAATLTFDGVDVMGHRLAEEVEEVVREWPGLKRISFIAHSLGGLVARYAIGQLYTPPNTKPLPSKLGDECPVLVSSEGTILGLEPVNFVTVATPHIGSRGSRQLPILCGLNFLEKVAVYSAHWFVGRTGRHLFLTDSDEDQIPLLLCMVADCSKGKFMSALRAFKRRVAYANIDCDHMVGWRTATLRRECEVPEVKAEPADENYPHILRIENLPLETEGSTRVGKEALDPVEEEMIRGLRRVSWQVIDVSFAKTAQKLDAHSAIQVKTYRIHSAGVDVIAHIIDNFVL